MKEKQNQCNNIHNNYNNFTNSHTIILQISKYKKINVALLKYTLQILHIRANKLFGRKTNPPSENLFLPIVSTIPPNNGIHPYARNQ
eukprot:UN21306